VSDPHLLTLSNETTSVEISAARGGSILSYRSRVAGRNYDWLLPASSTQPSCFAMLPYCSRIRGGCFEFAGRRIALTPNNLPEPHSIHGHGWQQNWRVVGADGSRVELSYLHESDEWPWRYLAGQRFELDDMSLRIRLSLQNLSAEPMPAGVGVHPYFSSTPQTKLALQAGSLWELDDQLMTVRRRSLPDGSDSRLTLMAGAVAMDRVYSGRCGALSLLQPERQAVIHIDADDVFAHLIVYAQPAQNFVCVEPVSNVADAFNLAAREQPGAQPGDLFQIIAPEATLAGSIVFSPEFTTTA